MNKEARATLILANPQLDAINPVEKKKYLQKVKIIKQLYLRGSRTNAEICSAFNISSPTAMGLLNEMITEGIIEKQGRGKSDGGRKPELYGLRHKSLYILSIVMGRFATTMAIFDNNNNNVTGIRSFPVPISEDISVIDELYKHSTALIQQSGINTDKLIGIGMSMPGLIASKEGMSHTYLLSKNGSLTLKEVLQNKFKKPVYIENDVKSAALAEYRFGLAKNRKDVLLLSLDWGVGLGIIIDGKLLAGTSGFAGEIGHIPLVNNGDLCYCGKRGCLETVASGIALARMAKEGLRSGQNSLLNKLCDYDIEKIEPQLVIDAANEGDQYAINLLSEIGINLGKGIAILIQLLNPELIILGGKIAEAKQYITTPIQQAINTYSMTRLRDKAMITVSDLGPNAGVLGSVAIVMENLFKDQIDDNWLN
jgi:N-acetylglucosamine repressor